MQIQNGQFYTTSSPTPQKYCNFFLETLLVDIQHDIQHSYIVELPGAHGSLKGVREVIRVAYLLSSEVCHSKADYRLQNL